MAYTTAVNIYNYTPVSQSDVAGNIITQYISDATAALNREINSKVIRERVYHIDAVRENEIDGVNKKFFARKSNSGVYFGDLNDDGEVDTADVIVHIVDSNDNETQATITAIDHEDMSVTLSTAPSADTKAIYLTYCYTYFDVTIPDILIEMATRYLAASYAFTKTEFGLGDNVKIGNISVTGINRKSGMSDMMNRFTDILIKIKTFGNTKNLPVSHIRI